MVGLVCMKESGDRGKMCFCETDYCNGQVTLRPPAFSIISALLTMIALLMIKKSSSTLVWQAYQGHISTAKNNNNNNNIKNINMNHKADIGGEDSGRNDGHLALGQVVAAMNK